MFPCRLCSQRFWCTPTILNITRVSDCDVDVKLGELLFEVACAHKVASQIHRTLVVFAPAWRRSQHHGQKWPYCPAKSRSAVAPRHLRNVAMLFS